MTGLEMHVLSCKDTHAYSYTGMEKNISTATMSVDC